jgi:hypothetical protein
VKEVWMVNATNSSIQVVDANVRYTKLIFPLQEKASWNGNANNTMPEWDYFYDYINKKEILNGNLFEKVLLVKQKDYRTLISYEYYVEKYAEGVGLISREIKDLLSNSIIANKPVEDRIERGIIYKQTLVTYGLLRSASAYHGYRRVYPHEMTPVTVAGFVLLNPRFPRSITHSVREIRRTIDGLLENEELLHMRFAPKSLDQLTELANWRPQQMISYGLHEYLDQVQLMLNELNQDIDETFFLARYSAS